jgi:hypothetical protein
VTDPRDAPTGPTTGATAAATAAAATATAATTAATPAPSRAGAASATQPPEQLRYAAVLSWGARVGLWVLIVSFAVYVLGLFEAHVPPSRLPEVWEHPVGRYLELTGMPTGWDWLGLIHRGDIAGLAGIAILAGCSLPALLSLVPLFLRRDDRTFALLCLAEVAVIVFAASGWLGGGH